MAKKTNSSCIIVGKTLEAIAVKLLDTLLFSGQ